MGMVMSQWQWLRASLLRPVFSDPKSKATRADANAERTKPSPSASVYSGCSCFRSPTAVVPTTRLQSATASATVANSFALGEDGGRIHGGTCFFQAHGVVIHQPQIGKAKTMHGPRDRADVVGVARPHQHHAHPLALLFAQHRFIFGRAKAFPVLLTLARNERTSSGIRGCSPALRSRRRPRSASRFQHYGVGMGAGDRLLRDPLKDLNHRSILGAHHDRAIVSVTRPWARRGGR